MSGIWVLLTIINIITFTVTCFIVKTDMWYITNEPSWLHSRILIRQNMKCFIVSLEHVHFPLFPSAASLTASTVFTLCKLRWHVYNGHDHTGIRHYLWVQLVCCVCLRMCACPPNFLAVLLMPEHSLSPSQTLETAWPVTRRFTRLWLKRHTRKQTSWTFRRRSFVPQAPERKPCLDVTTHCTSIAGEKPSV